MGKSGNAGMKKPRRFPRLSGDRSPEVAFRTTRPSNGDQALAGVSVFAAAARRAFLIMACIVAVGSAPLLSQ